MSLIRVEVRCCCEPGRLLGTLDVPEHYLERGHSINVAVSIQRTMVKTIRHPFVRFEVDTFTGHSQPTADMSVKDLQMTRRCYLALKKPHDVTIEDLRMLVGFIESSRTNEGERDVRQ